MTKTRTKNYDELEGAQGPAVRFRPERYSQVDFGPMDLTVSLSLGDGRLTPVLCDVSQNGVAVVWPADLEVPAVGAQVSDVVIRVDNHETYRGGAVVTSVRPRDEQWVVGASFTDGLMDVDDVLGARDVRLWQVRDGMDLSVRRRPWHVEGADRFKSLVCELRLLLEDTRTDLDRLEKELPWSVLNGEESAARTTLIDVLRTGFVAEMTEIGRALDDEMKRVAPEQLPALKRLSQRHLDELMMPAPILHRARTKPLNYPGDFEIMRYIYERPFEGATLFGRAMHLWGVSFDPSAMIRSRKDHLKAQLIELLSRSRRSDVIRIISVAAGPAQEVYETLAEVRDIPGEVEIVLFDQDKRALSFAFPRLQQLVATRWGSRVRIVYLHDSIKRLLRDPTLLQQNGGFDVVLCAGLFDYLDQQKSTQLTSSLYASLRPGGSAWIGNVVPEVTARWLLEFHLDWYCIYKSREETLDFATQGAPGAEVRIDVEPMGYNLFAVVTRPG
jgi:extracellular factor (EF) 3-hydroxypalmitic acid methyl ester biosynthesis protein